MRGRKKVKIDTDFNEYIHMFGILNLFTRMSTCCCKGNSSMILFVVVKC